MANLSKFNVSLDDNNDVSKMNKTNVSEVNVPFHVTNDDTQFDLSCTIVFVVSILGVIGNAVTLFAFRYAKDKKKFRFHRSWKNITVFIWNLALIDLISSMNMTVLYTQFLFYPTSINNWTLCVTEITLRDIFVLINAAGKKNKFSCAIILFMFERDQIENRK